MRMGKRLKQQRRGKGSPSYAAPHTRFNVDLSYRNYDDIEKAGVLKGVVTEFIDDPAHHAILMRVKYENNEEGYLIAPEGIAIGDTITVGAQGQLSLGAVLPLYRIPDGMYIFNIEKKPGDGGKLVRAPGSYATVVSKKGNEVYIKLPSKRIIAVSNECRAQVGIIAGGGRLNKPLLKAGNAFYKYRARNRLWPKVRGVHMAAYCHPHGGKQHHAGKPTVVKRSAPPGAKVGHIAARSTGRKKAKKTIEEVM
jgi:large subunit ribosomal protein L2